jgi:hypothetical protein
LAESGEGVRIQPFGWLEKWLISAVSARSGWDAA